MGTGRSLGGLSVALGAGLFVCGACGSDASHGPTDGNDAGGSDVGVTGVDGQAAGDGQALDSAGLDALGARGDAPVEASMPPPQMTKATCTLPIQAVNVSTPTTVVGDGTAASCTEQALAAAVAKGGFVTFRCSASATITVTRPIQLPIDRDTVIDGGNLVSLDGGGTTRILQFMSPNFRATTATVTLQNLSIVHGKATGTAIPVAPAPCSQGFAIDGGGAGIYVRDGKLHVIHVQFSDNHAASSGPDVGGGAIYAEGSLDVTVVESSFVGNSGSNGGAIGSLNSDLTLVNDSFSNNQAMGSGGNQINPSCTVNGGESGNGGNSGAVGIDGGLDGATSVCGCSFAHNSAGALGGALARTADAAMQAVNIDQSTFDSNTAVQGGGAMYIHNCALSLKASTVSNNTARGGGGVQADGTTIDFVNDTLAANTASHGLGGGLALFSGGGTILSSTFANNLANGGAGFFGAAIAGGTMLTMDNTIFSLNSSQDCGSPMACQDGASTGQANLQWPQLHMICVSPDPPCATGTIFADPMLSDLAVNGGPTRTMLPLAGSTAFGAGQGCPATDQRGVARKPNGCTIGAVESP